jgi:hypothetical protein
MLNEWVMRSRVQTMNRKAEQMRLMRIAGGSDERATSSSIETMLASMRGLANSVSSAPLQAARGAQVIKAWLGLASMPSEDQAEA